MVCILIYHFLITPQTSFREKHGKLTKVVFIYCLQIFFRIILKNVIHESLSQAEQNDMPYGMNILKVGVVNKNPLLPRKSEGLIFCFMVAALF